MRATCHYNKNICGTVKFHLPGSWLQVLQSEKVPEKREKKYSRYFVWDLLITTSTMITESRKVELLLVDPLSNSNTFPYKTQVSNTPKKQAWGKKTWEIEIVAAEPAWQYMTEPNYCVGVFHLNVNLFLQLFGCRSKFILFLIWISSFQNETIYFLLLSRVTHVILVN